MRKRARKILIPTIKILNDWHDDLIWCPSQCYLLIEYNNKQYTIYLRWRWEDPWTCDLVEGDLTSSEFDYKSKSLWTDDLFIDKNTAYFFRDSELDKAKEKALEVVQSYLERSTLEGLLNS